MSQTPSAPAREYPRLRKLAWLLKRVFIDHWLSKLLALLLALVLWAGLIVQDPSLTREKTFQDVTVNVIGTDTLKRNGFIVVSDMASVLQDVDLKVDVPQRQYANAQASNYNVRIDLSRISGVGEQDVRIMTTNSATYGTVASISTSTVRLEVDAYVSASIPVNVVVEGEPPEGYYALTPTADPAELRVSGPKSIVEQISRADVVVNQSRLPAREGAVRTAERFVLLGQDDQPIVSDLLQVTDESVLVSTVTVDQRMQSMRTVNVSDLGLVTGEPARGYEVRNVYFTPSEMPVAGSRALLDKLNMLYLNSGVDVTGRSESFTVTQNLRRQSGVTYLWGTDVTIAVEIAPRMISRTFTGLPLSVKGAAEGLVALTPVTTASVTITGPQLWLESLDRSAVHLSVDVTGLPAGEAQAYVLCSVDGGEDAIVSPQPETVRVILTALE